MPVTARLSDVGHLPVALSDAGAGVIGQVGYLVGGEDVAPVDTVIELRIS